MAITVFQKHNIKSQVWNLGDNGFGLPAILKFNYVATGMTRQYLDTCQRPTSPNPHLFTIKTTGYYVSTVIRHRI